ncbi:MAG: MFS transporter [Actinobacteria bacterium]|nr:MFS transporter [Actinomycetota bacterium]MCA1722574.1 MFS transporter [Actinomycetota bacterium]
MSRRSLVLVATSLASFTATLDNTVVAVALRDVQRDLGAGVSGLQGVVTAYTVSLAALLLTGGTLADVAGRRRVFLGGLAVFAGASIGCALSDSVTALVAWRAVQGAGAALVIPGGLAVLADAYPDGRERGRAIGIWAATGALALAVGPVVGGLLVRAHGWPAVFEVNVPLCAAVAAVVLFAPAGAPSPKRRLDLPGQVLVAAGLAATTYAVVLAGRDGFGRPVAVALAFGLAALAAFGVVEHRAVDPLLPRGLLTDCAFVGTTAAAFAASLAVFVLLVFLSLFLQLVQQLEALPAALRLLPLTVGLVVAAPVAVRLRARVAVVSGLVVAAAGVLLVAAALTPDIGALVLGALLGLVGIGLGLVGAPVVVASLDAVSSSRRGLAAATVNAARELGGVVAIGGLGALVVARLAADLTTRLVQLGVPRGRSADLVDAVLRGAPALQVARKAGPGVGLDALLQLRSAAAASYVSSTRVALVGAAVVLLLAAAVAARTLGRPDVAPDASTPGAAGGA